MPITLLDTPFKYSGGTTNYDPNFSLGGAMSDHEIVTNVSENLFGEVSLDESRDGLTDYRCFYVENTHVEDSLLQAAVFIEENTESPDTAITIGLDPAGMNANAQTIADRLTAPVGVTFLDYPSSGNGLALGDLTPGDFISIWVKRVVSAGASTPTSDPFTLRLTGVPDSPIASPTSP